MIRYFYASLWVLFSVFAAGTLQAQAPIGDINAAERDFDKYIAEGKYNEASSIGAKIAQYYWYEIGNPKKAVESFEKCIKVFEKTSDRGGIARVHNLIGMIHSENEHFELALASFKTSLEIRRKINSKSELCTSLLNVGGVYVEMKKYEEGLTILNEGLLLARELKIETATTDFYKYISICYEQTGEKEKAFKYYKLYNSNYNEESEGYINSLEEGQQRIQQAADAAIGQKERKLAETNMELSEVKAEKELIEKLNRLKETEIELLNKEKEILKKDKELQDLVIKDKENQLELQTTIRNAFIGGFLALLLIAGILVKMIQNRNLYTKNLEKRNAEIMEQKQEIQNQKDQIQLKNAELESQKEEILAQNEEIERIVAYLENANDEINQQKDQLEKSRDSVRTLTKIGQSITSRLQVESVISTLHENIQKIIVTDSFQVGLLNPTMTKVVYQTFDQKKETVNETTVNLKEYNESFEAVTLRNGGKPILINDLSAEPPYKGPAESGGGLIKNAMSVLYMPVNKKDESIGIMALQSRHTDAFTQHDIDLLTSLATYTAIALDNSSNFEKLQTAKSTIENKNRNILDSIRYAEKIQKALLPNSEKAAPFVAESFILYKPKDIVSGDFYWFTEQDEKLIAAVADCTGHGVPGAFMSMIGNVLLNEIIIQKKITNPGTVLEMLHSGVRASLRQQNQINDDGMDLCLCTIEKYGETGGKLLFSGAKRPLYIVSGGVLTEIKASRKSIGGRQKETERVFEESTVHILHGDMLYLSTDGISDQNNRANQKIGSIGFKEMLLKYAELPAEKQHDALLADFQAYRKGVPQRDDVTVVGFRM